MLRSIFALSRPVHREFLDAITLTEGNPLFIEEVLTSLIAAGDIFYRDGAWDRKPMAELRIPGSVQDAVQQRAALLNAPAQELLRLVGVVGRRFDFAFIAHRMAPISVRCRENLSFTSPCPIIAAAIDVILLILCSEFPDSRTTAVW